MEIELDANPLLSKLSHIRKLLYNVLENDLFQQYKALYW